jgi:hypothetical protein
MWNLSMKVFFLWIWWKFYVLMYENGK